MTRYLSEMSCNDVTERVASRSTVCIGVHLDEDLLLVNAPAEIRRGLEAIPFARVKIQNPDRLALRCTGIDWVCCIW